MQNTLFYRLGTLVFRFRWATIGLWILLILGCAPFLPHILTPFTTTGFIDEKSESARTETYINQKLGYDNKNKFIILYHSETLVATSSSYRNKIKKSLSELKNFPIEHEIIYPENNNKQISKDKHTSYVVVLIKSQEPLSDNLLTEFQSAIKAPPQMTMHIGGEPIFIANVNKQTQTDLYNADVIAAPVSLIILILVFGSVFAALLPLFLGGGCALIILTTLYFLGQAFTLSIFTLNIALLLGLCLSLDYSLFIINRFRDELKNEREMIETISITQATAGKAIFFGGLAVFVSLSALLLFPINILFSVAVGGLTAVVVAVLMAITLLPALLAVLKTKINWFPIRLFKMRKGQRLGFWHWLAEKIVKRPLLVFNLTLIFLLMLGYPFLSAKFGVSDYHILPKNSEHRQFYELYSKQFNDNELNPILLVAQTPQDILSRNNLAKLYEVTRKLKDNPLIQQVNSIVTTNSKFTKEQYYKLYHMSEDRMKTSVKQLLETTTGNYFTVITIISKYGLNSSNNKMLITQLHDTEARPGMKLQLTGMPVSNSEVLDCIAHILPYAIIWIIVSTYIILLILFRSLFLPLKAIVMNIISLSACYGALVLVFQEGYLHQLLNFDPQGMLDISLLVIIFCALFGFSIDYEVFLLSRIKEAYEATADNEKSIIFGIEKSSRIITSAAIIVITLCFSFLVADILMVKAFGLGIAVAIFVDAFLIRTFLVPATMMLVKKWNWYLPKWLDRILPRL